ncbi:hypothetical protein DL768_008477 [Monosporascus sp. mg162]|nr:hypothetical protein DL768_008477 [Monosporascus sp. mg162]
MLPISMPETLTQNAIDIHEESKPHAQHRCSDPTSAIPPRPKAHPPRRGALLPTTASTTTATVDRHARDADGGAGGVVAADGDRDGGDGGLAVTGVVAVVVTVTIWVEVGPQLQPAPQPTQPSKPPRAFQPQPGPVYQGLPSKRAQASTVATAPPLQVGGGPADGVVPVSVHGPVPGPGVPLTPCADVQYESCSP